MNPTEERLQARALIKELRMMKDPVCGMQVDEKTSPTSTYSGKQYAFCGPDCKDAFDHDPDKYAAGSKREQVGKL
jgi:YHS domain-containing protein